MSDRSQSILDKFFAQALGEHIVVQGREERFKSLLSELIDAELAATNPTSASPSVEATSETIAPDTSGAQSADSGASEGVDPTQPIESSPSAPSSDAASSTPTEPTSDGSSPSSKTEYPTKDSANSSAVESPVSEATNAA